MQTSGQDLSPEKYSRYFSLSALILKKDSEEGGVAETSASYPYLDLLTAINDGNTSVVHQRRAS
ncbi:hypothetical protein KIN20_026053 [Parelaphostrongylus tenuis]|uniref:Uncharacterized protein n=1 Tax=Parelaphostrongylus tenuis TaxID=148309 RepID=A0AAD5QUU6_PARTN|nr:hypothetical protein KIN20_026053 [Parelaphostrongylus tenuis]